MPRILAHRAGGRIKVRSSRGGASYRLQPGSSLARCGCGGDGAGLSALGGLQPRSLMPRTAPTKRAPDPRLCPPAVRSCIRCHRCPDDRCRSRGGRSRNRRTASKGRGPSHFWTGHSGHGAGTGLDSLLRAVGPAGLGLHRGCHRSSVRLMYSVGWSTTPCLVELLREPVSL